MATHKTTPDQQQREARAFAGTFAETGIKAVVQRLVQAGETGFLSLASDEDQNDVKGDAGIWFVDGAPRQACCKGAHGIPALARIAELGPNVAFAFRPDQLHQAELATIEGDADSILFAMFGGREFAAADTADLLRAEDVQRHVMARLPTVPGHHIATHYQGMSRVSGDFFIADHLPDGRLLVALGDLTGHGMQAALNVSSALKTLRLLTREYSDLVKIIARLNTELCEDLLSNQFCTASFAAINLATHTVEVVLAGHHPALLVDLVRQRHRPVGKAGPILGVIPTASFKPLLRTVTCKLDPGTCLLQYSDGFTEAADEQGRLFGEHGLDQVVAGRSRELAGELVEDLVAACNAHAPEPSDDRTMIAISRPPRHSAEEAVPPRERGGRRSISVRLAETDDRSPLALAELQELPLPQRLLQEAAGAIGDYLLQDPIGGGGQGTVFEARQAALDRTVAYKRLHESLERSDPRYHRFLLEARLTANLEHPNIVPIYELGQDSQGQAFFTMKRMHGRPWSLHIGGEDIDFHLDVLIRVANAIAFAHAHDIIHRDIKPSNVILGDFGEVLVVDWGLAAYIGVPQGRFAHLASPPSDGVLVGSPAYMAPEMADCRIEDIGVGSDVYLLGACLFEVLTGGPPHPGDTAQECIAAARENRIATTPSSDTHLLDIARRALATDPAQRPESVIEFLAEIRLYRQHRHSLTLCDRAREHLAGTALDYEDFTRAGNALEQALVLWPENPRARSQLSQTRLAYAEAALERGDLDLALAQIDSDDPNHAVLRRRIDQARDTRQRQAEAAGRLRDLEHRLHQERGRSWIGVYRSDFATRPWHADWELLGGDCTVDGDRLVLANGKPQVLLFREPVPGDCRIRFTVSQTGSYINDISILLGVHWQDDGNLDSMLQSGYQIKYGAYDNTLNLLLRRGKRLWVQPDRPLAADRALQVEIERIGSLLALRVDGDVVFAQEDDDPPVGAESNRLGLAGWIAETHFRDIAIDVLGTPLTADLLETADRHLRLGHYQTACDLYDDVLASGIDAEGRRHAQRQRGRAEEMQQAAARLPAMAEELRGQWPQAEITTDGTALTVHLSGTDVDDLTPLSGLPVRGIEVQGLGLSDLEPLRGAPLQSAQLARNRFTDLEPIYQDHLTHLYVYDNPLQEWGPIERCPELRLLVAYGCSLTDLAPLQGLPLETLNLDRNPGITSLAALRGMPLKGLHLRFVPVTDFGPLTDCPLRTLHLSGHQLDSLEALARFTSLRQLVLDGQPVSDLTPLAACRLQAINLTRTRVADLTPLDPTDLVYLDLRQTPAAKRPLPFPMREIQPGLFMRGETGSAFFETMRYD